MTRKDLPSFKVYQEAVSKFLVRHPCWDEKIFSILNSTSLPLALLICKVGIIIFVVLNSRGYGEMMYMRKQRILNMIL